MFSKLVSNSDDCMMIIIFVIWHYHFSSMKWSWWSTFLEMQTPPPPPPPNDLKTIDPFLKNKNEYTCITFCIEYRIYGIFIHYYFLLVYSSAIWQTRSITYKLKLHLYVLKLKRVFTCFYSFCWISHTLVLVSSLCKNLAKSKKKVT